jgi:hypothetical protein
LVAGSAQDATPLERAIVDLARKSWSRPRRLAPADVEPLRAAAGDGALEYVLVLGGFHFITRVADLLGVAPELLPSALRRFELLRRAGVRMLANALGRMDLAGRRYAGTYEEAAQRLSSVSERVLGRRPSAAALDRVAMRPWALELVALALEERERSSLPRRALTDIQRIVEASLPDSTDDATGFHPRPADPVAAFAMVGTRYAQRATPAMIEALRSRGHDDIGILDLAVAVADANQWARVHRLLGLPAALYYDVPAECRSAAVEAVA